MERKGRAHCIGNFISVTYGTWRNGWEPLATDARSARLATRLRRAAHARRPGLTARSPSRQAPRGLPGARPDPLFVMAGLDEKTSRHHHHHFVMATLDAAIHVFAQRSVGPVQGDARIKSAHDDVGERPGEVGRWSFHFPQTPGARSARLAYAPSARRAVARSGPSARSASGQTLRLLPPLWSLYALVPLLTHLVMRGLDPRIYW